MAEKVLVGWKAIAEVFSKTSRTIIKKRLELLESGLLLPINPSIIMVPKYHLTKLET